MATSADEAIYRQLAPELIRFAQALVGRDDAADVMSNAFVKAMSSPRWPEVVAHRSYLYRAVLNEAHTWRRRRSRRTAIEAAGSGPDHWVDPPALGADPALVAAIERLPLRQRAVIVLAYWSDLRPSEIADRLGVSEGSVRRHLARARARLREVLA